MIYAVDYVDYSVPQTLYGFAPLHTSMDCNQFSRFYLIKRQFLLIDVLLICNQETNVYGFQPEYESKFSCLILVQ